jgi:divalent metal cation (Fe/Co/Zn/Cd) transporter
VDLRDVTKRSASAAVRATALDTSANRFVGLAMLITLAGLVLLGYLIS